jgi:tetratricopeptide (TPR) repeat protein
VAELVAARRALAAGDLAAAEQAAGRAVHADPRLADAWLVLGLAQFRQAHYHEARRSFAAQLAIDPKSSLGRYNLASAAFEEGDVDVCEREYLAVAQSDPELGALALERAGLCASAAEAWERARSHLTSALFSARVSDDAQVEADAVRDLASLEHERSQRGQKVVFATVRAARLDLDAGRTTQAAAGYRRALDLARTWERPAEDRAEIAYGLGLALYRLGDPAEAVLALEQATTLAPNEPDFHFWLGTTRYDLESDDEQTRTAFERALALGLSGSQADRARRYLRDLGAPSSGAERWFEGSVGTGFDSNVVQSGTFTTVARTPGPVAAPFVTAELGGTRTFNMGAGRLLASYRLSEVAYVSDALDPYSLQEHAVATEYQLQIDRRARVSLSLAGYYMFAGLENFTPFQWGLGPELALTLHATPNVDTVFRLAHTWKNNLETGFDALSGNRDDAGVAFQWRRGHGQATLSYRLRADAVGVQRVPLVDLTFPQLLAAPDMPGAAYVIPGAYLSHQGTLGWIWIGERLRGIASASYEYRDYGLPSYIDGSGGRTDTKLRIDHEVTLVAQAEWKLRSQYCIALAYSAYINRSTIDNLSAAGALDYDNKNYVKHVVEMALNRRF